MRWPPWRSPAICRSRPLPSAAGLSKLVAARGKERDAAVVELDEARADAAAASTARAAVEAELIRMVERLQEMDRFLIGGFEVLDQPPASDADQAVSIAPASDP